MHCEQHMIMCPCVNVFANVTKALNTNFSVFISVSLIVTYNPYKKQLSCKQIIVKLRELNQRSE